MLDQTSNCLVCQPTTTHVDRHAAHRRYLRRRLQRRRSALRARLLAPSARRPEGRQLLQRWRQRLRIRRGLGLPAAGDDDDYDSDWTTSVVIRTSQPPANRHNCRLGHRRRTTARCDVAGWCRSTNNAPYVVAVTRTCCLYGLHTKDARLSVAVYTWHCRVFVWVAEITECPMYKTDLYFRVNTDETYRVLTLSEGQCNRLLLLRSYID